MTKQSDDVAATQAITDVIYRYCRALDRMDRELALSCWHPDGTDDHSPLFSGTARGFVDWVWSVHAAMLFTRHMITNIQIAVRGDHAGAESYVSLILRVPRGDDVYDLFLEGRYIDTFDNVGGVWAIRHRKQIRDWSRIEKVDPALSTFDPPLIPVHTPGLSVTLPSRDRSDYSYQVLGKAR